MCSTALAIRQCTTTITILAILLLLERVTKIASTCEKLALAPAVPLKDLGQTNRSSASIVIVRSVRWVY
ncbi:hypothetical protein J1614_003746 [Plenodomus biglobosus]|nr:hypothetical protein J1614_003746 [Plenodomus biglobosus]